MNKTRISFFVTSLLLILFSGLTLAQGQSDFKPPNVELEAKLEPVSVRAGEQVRAVISANFDEGWHIYSVIPSEDKLAPPPTRVNWEPHSFVAQGPLYETNPITQHDPALGMVLSYHENRVNFYQNFKVPENISLGSGSLKAAFRYQTCSDRLCLPPKTVQITLPFEVETGTVRPEYAYMNRVIDEIPEDGAPVASSESLDSALAGGIWGFIALAALMGSLAWLTPCVFPMIPITVSFFSKQSHGSNRELLGMASLFALGIVVTYTGTGIILASFLGAAGAVQLATNPWMNLLIALLFVFFGLSLMGVFDLELPNNWVQSLDQVSRRMGGVAGVLLMGMVFTLTAFTCTVQFVGTLLIAAAQGEWMWPIVGMLVFSSVFAFPFFLLALFPRWIGSFQSKSGTWMIQMKFILGFVELMAAFKFLSNADLIWQWNLISRTAVLGAWLILLLGIFLVILGKFPGVFQKESPKGPQLIAILPVIAVFAYLGYGASGKHLDGWTDSYLPPDVSLEQQNSASVSVLLEDVESVHALPWLSNLDEALLQAKTSKKPIFIDFTGYTCVNCRWMEKNVFAEKSVYASLKSNFILVQLYTDGGEGYEANQKLQVERFRTIALPYYVILSPENAVLAKHAGISTPLEFLDFLKKG